MWKYKETLSNLFTVPTSAGYRMLTGTLFLIGIKNVIVYPNDNYVQFSGLVFFVLAYCRHTRTSRRDE